jgi:hypothetical protein
MVVKTTNTLGTKVEQIEEQVNVSNTIDENNLLL